VNDFIFIDFTVCVQFPLSVGLLKRLYCIVKKVQEGECVL